MTERDRRSRAEDSGPQQAGEKQVERMGAYKISQVELAGAIPAPDGEPGPGMMKIDLHCHSEASNDCSTPLELIPPRCSRREVRIQAITDHNQIWGAQKLQELVEEKREKTGIDLTVIVGEEISTAEGEIIGLFLKEAIQPGLSPEETIARIKAQGGLVLIPHGFDPMKRWRLKPEALERIASAVDIIETFNARISRPRWNRAAVSWAEARRVLMSAGSDAHTLADIGSAWVEVPRRPVREPQDLLAALARGMPLGEWTHPALAFAYKLWDRTHRRFGF